MDEQFNSGSNPEKSEKTATYWDGPLLSQAIQNRKRIYDDDTITLYAFVYNDRVFIDSKLYGPHTLSSYKHWLTVRDCLDVELESKGVKEFYAIVDSPEKFRWCEFIGMETTYTVLDDKYEIMKREVNGN